MTIGIKVGPQKTSFEDLQNTNAKFAEVWFDVNRADEYLELFSFMKKRNISFGLHFWGALSDGTWTTLAYPDSRITKASFELIKQTIDIAARHQCIYVNIHPGTRSLSRIDFKNQTFTLIKQPVDVDVAQTLFFQHAEQLHAHADKAGVIFTVETVPCRVTDTWHGNEGRKHPKNIYELDNSVVVKWAQMGKYVANDFGHLAASFPDANAEKIIHHINSITDMIYSQTKLIHLGYIVPPYNGTDFHDSLTNPVFHTHDAIPNAIHMKTLIQKFTNREDVWLLAEPATSHVIDYQYILTDLLS